MNRHMDGNVTPTEEKMRRSIAVTVLCDVVIILALVICLMTYIFRNNADTYEQNIDTVSDIASASSQLVQAALDNINGELAGAYNYCDGRELEEILAYLSLVNGDDSDYQLLKRDEDASTALYHVYSGYSTKKDANGRFQEVTYADTALSLSLYTHAADQNGKTSYSQSFTNRTDALRYFAVFCGLKVSVEGRQEQYFLIKPQKESKLLNQAQTFTQYRGVSLAICYPDGKYLACGNGFRGDNFYDYLYRYNGLSLDEKNQLREQVQKDEDGAGVLAYSDYQKRECVFAYAACPAEDGQNWNVVIAVPTSEFVAENLLSFFPLTIILFLVVLLVFNISRLLLIVKQLRLSVKREMVANTAKSSFLSRMSHEIRTPLNAIIGYNTIAQGEIYEVRDEADRRQVEMKVMDCLSKSEIASKHLLNIINDVLDMAAIEGGKIKISHERFDFKGLITSLTTIFYSQARAKGVEFEVLFDTLTEEWFVGDQVRINQILTNLLTNAIKFTPTGGAVRLTITQPEAEANAAHIHFQVSDTGIGMEPEYLSRIWTPFEQADSSISRRFGGSGLGLSITKNLVDLMGGSITVTSAPGKGSSFGVDLTFERTQQQLKHDAYDFSSISALVVDDDVSTCDYIRLLFNRCGAKCAAVTSGADALKAIALAQEKGESYSLCLVDWRMPQMDGIETIRGIRRTVGRELPIIVLTAYDYSELADKAAEVGVSRFISKPLFQSSLFDLLAGVSGPQARKALKKNASIDFEGARVILAEDNAMNMEIAKAILQSVGLRVDCAWNGKEALELFEASPVATYMAVLMDVHMPVMDGHEATRAIRACAHAQAKTIPIIAMTADAFAENVAEAHAAGMNDHIAKPIDTATLFATLAKYKQSKA